MNDAPSSLCPGYKQVESFSTDEEYEEEEEICYVTLNVPENVEPTLVPSSTSYRLIGLDTPTPFLQLQGTVLQGRHDLLLGTELIFTDDKETQDWNKKSIVHVTNTEQRIAFQEVTLIPRSPNGKDGAVGEDIGENFEPSPEEIAIHIDRLTGLASTLPRSSTRKRKGTGQTSKKGKGKESKETKKSKGKEKEIVEQPEADVPMGENLEGDVDDMYMDIE